MKHGTRAALAGVLGLLLAACAKSDDTAAASSGAPSSAAASTGDDVADVASYELTMDRMDEYFASLRNIAIAMKDLPEEQRDISMDQEDGIDAYTAKLEANPTVRKAIDDAGSTPRDFALTGMAYLQAGMAAGVLAMRPNDNADSLAREMKASMDNIKFVREHEAELKQKTEAIQAELKRMGVSEDRD